VITAILICAGLIVMLSTINTIIWTYKQSIPVDQFFGIVSATFAGSTLFGLFYLFLKTNGGV
jgi:hypothetical protein